MHWVVIYFSIKKVVCTLLLKLWKMTPGMQGSQVLWKFKRVPKVIKVSKNKPQGNINNIECIPWKKSAVKSIIFVYLQQSVLPTLAYSVICINGNKCWVFPKTFEALNPELMMLKIWQHNVDYSFGIQEVYKVYE